MNHEEDIKEIQARNQRVEVDKAWEVSVFRRVLITGVTYVVALLWMMSIDVDSAALSAFIPTGGYVLSTLTLPPIKRWWIGKLNK